MYIVVHPKKKFILLKINVLMYVLVLLIYSSPTFDKKSKYFNFAYFDVKNLNQIPSMI